jgi:hypothetical protein
MIIRWKRKHISVDHAVLMAGKTMSEYCPRCRERDVEYERIRSHWDLACGDLGKAQKYIAQLEAEVQRLQRALSFWHPGVPAEGIEEMVNRAGDDAMLLFGYDGSPEKSARELGWITLTAPETICESTDCTLPKGHAGIHSNETEARELLHSCGLTNQQKKVKPNV